MVLVVQKFGGDAIATVEGIAHIADIVLRKVQLGCKLIVALSAMQGETDRLIKLAYSASPLSDKEALVEYDSIISTGEQVSSGLLALALQSKGIRARSWMAFQCGITASGCPTKGYIQAIRDMDTVLQSFNDYDVAIVAGFQALTAKNDRIITLGRNGTDVSAIALAVASKGKYCVIYKNVPGVYTADPAVCSRARIIAQLGYDEMLSMSIYGAVVLHPEAVRMAMQHDLTVQIRSIFAPDSIGTVVSADGICCDDIAIAVTHTAGLNLITVRYAAKNAGIYDVLVDNVKSSGIDVNILLNYDFTADSIVSRGLLTDCSSAERLIKFIHSTDTKKHIQVHEHRDVGQVSIVSRSINHAEDVLRHALSMLERAKIPVIASQSLGIRCTVVLQQGFVTTAVNLLHEDFIIAKTSIKDGELVQSCDALEESRLTQPLSKLASGSISASLSKLAQC